MGVVVDKLSFAHPQDLLHILETLRKQLLFNELLLSCMRKLSSALTTSTTPKPNANRILEIGLVEPFVVSIIMQHPRLMCYTTIEIDVSRGNVETRFRDHNDLHNPNVISEIVRRCHSIPVTIRALLMKYKQPVNVAAKRKGNLNNNSDNSDSNGNSNANPTNGGHKYSSNSNGSGGGNNFGGCNFKNSDDQYKDENEVFDDEGEELHLTPRSLMNSDSRRITPSRSDSYTGLGNYKKKDFIIITIIANF